MHSDILSPGWILVSRDEKKDPGAWFIFHHDEYGTAAFDLTTEHPSISYHGFKTALAFEDSPETEKVVLLGGLERPDDALIILHETKAATDESNQLNNDFSFLSYNYVLLPGKPPAVTTPDNRPSKIRLKRKTGFLIAMGYRVWEGAVLRQELESGRWLCLPATPGDIFGTGRRDRRAKILNRLN